MQTQIIKYLLGFFFLLSSGLQAHEVYVQCDFPTYLPGWDVQTKADGSILLRPKKMHRDLPPQTMRHTPPPHTAMTPPEQEPRQQFESRPGNNEYFVYEDYYSHQPPSYSRPDTAFDNTRENKQPKSDRQRPIMLDNFPEHIPGWDITMEPDGSRLLIPQYAPPPPEQESRQQFEFRPDNNEYFAHEDYYSYHLPLGSSPDAVFDFPEEIYGWHIVTEPDGSRLLFPEYPNEPHVPYEFDSTQADSRTMELEPYQQGQSANDCFEVDQENIVEEAETESFDPGSTATQDNSWGMIIEPESSKQHTTPPYDAETTPSKQESRQQFESRSDASYDSPDRIYSWHIATDLDEQPPVPNYFNSMEPKPYQQSQSDCFEVENNVQKNIVEVAATEQCDPSTTVKHNVWQIENY